MTSEKKMLNRPNKRTLVRWDGMKLFCSLALPSHPKDAIERFFPESKNRFGHKLTDLRKPQ